MGLIRVLKWDVPLIGEAFSVFGIRVVLFSPQESLFSGSGILHVWTECFADIGSGEHVKLDLIVYPTGHPFSQKNQHLMSCKDGSYIWHLYQVVK